MDTSEVSALEAAVSEIAEAAPVLRAARVIALEQVMCIALRQTDPEKARALLRDVDTTLANQTDGVQESMVHATLYKASIQQLRG